MPVGRFAAGFGSYEAKVIVEIDGDAHDKHHGDAHARYAAFESRRLYRAALLRGRGDMATWTRVMAQIGQAMAVWNG